MTPQLTDTVEPSPAAARDAAPAETTKAPAAAGARAGRAAGRALSQARGVVAPRHSPMRPLGIAGVVTAGVLAALLARRG